jgi:signal transduction histidine kinase
MNLLSSLRSRIFLTSALLAVLSIGVAIYVVNVTVTREAESALDREIEATGALFEQLRATRAQTFMMMARLIADAPRLKAAVDTNDPATVQPPLEDIASQNQLTTNLLLVTNRTGKVLATVGVPSRAGVVVANQPAIRQALAGRETVSLLPQPGGMLQLVTVPILIGPLQPDILGTLSVGFLLDDTLAAQLKQITGSEIAFGMDGQILATTIPNEHRASLGTLARRVEGSTNVTLGADEYVALPLTLSPSDQTEEPGSGPVALILRSRTEHLRFLRTIHTELYVAAVVAVLLATLLSFTVARTITRPLAAITGVMREVAATGDLTRKIELRGGDEDARLLAATFTTLTDSIARFQREMTQRERLSSLGRLSTVIAHEVRNPLMIIKAALHTLRQPEVDGPALREAAADIDEEVARLNRIVNDVLDFARPIRFEKAPADLNALCRESAAAAQASPGAPVDLDLDASPPIVTTDAERLRGALVNLIVNARQAFDGRPSPPATPSAGSASPASRENIAGADGRPRVIVSTRTSTDGVTITVADNGHGIDETDLSKVFDPYFTTKRGGTGLGLPIAKNIIEGLGGVLTIASTVGRGTQMRIDFPTH